MRFMKLFEQAMSYQDALSVFEITSVPSEDELKKLYRKLSLDNHPDRGGSIEKMQDINQAYEILKKNVGSGSSSSTKFDWEAAYARQAEKRERCLAFFRKNLDTNKFKEHFEKFYTGKLIIEVNEGKYDKHSGDHISPEVILRNEDNTTYFVVRYHISIQSSSGGLGYTGLNEDDLIFNVATTTSIYHDKRSLKVNQSRYTFGAKTKAIIDPSEIFPDAKLKKIFSGEAAAKKKFRKSDMFLGLARELKVSIDGDQVFIYPFGKDVNFYFNIYRFVIMKSAGWMLGGIQFKLKKIGERFPLKTVTLEETEETLTRIVELVNTFKKEALSSKLDPINDGEKLAKLLQKIADFYFKKD